MAMLPDDLLRRGILQILPIKSGMRFKCICKSWLELIDHIGFPRLHFDQSNQNNDQLILATLGPDRDCHGQVFYSLKCEVLCLLAKDMSFCLPPLSMDVNIVNTCNGLICLSDYSTLISLWNPTTREYVKLPSSLPRVGPLSKLYATYHTLMGLGCDASMEEYKLISLVFFYETDKTRVNYSRCKVKVQTLGTNYWRNVPDSCLRPFYDQPSQFEYDTRLVNFRGALHWAARHYTGHRIFIYIIVSFDVKNEKFGEIPLPDVLRERAVLQDDNLRRCFKVDVLQGCLSVVSYKCPHLEVWTMRDYSMKDSWTRVLSVCQYFDPAEPPLVFSKHEKLEVQGMDLDEHVIDVFNPITKTCKPFRFYVDPGIVFSKIAYMESYISIASLTGEHDYNGPSERRLF